MLTLLALAVPAATASPTGCDAPPPAELLDQLAAGTSPFADPNGEQWSVLGRSADARARVVACARATGSTADTVVRQWLVEAIRGEPPATISIGVRLDSSFEEAFTGPVRVARSTRVPASIPVWEVCGHWESGDTGDGARSANGCRLVVSPVAARGVENATGQRVVTFLAEGERPFMDFLAWFDTRSAWAAIGGGWRITETWTWRDPSSGAVPLGGDGLPRAPLTQESEVRWDPTSAAFTVTRVGACGNHEAALSALDPNGQPCPHP